MINLTPEDIAEFIAIWKAEFDEVLTEDQARHHAGRLLKLYVLLSRKLPNED